MARPPVPPFTQDTAKQKVRAAENAWNRREPSKVAQAYTPDSQWRNRAQFITGRNKIEAFLTQKWHREIEYRLIKELWAYTNNRIAVRFAYECVMIAVAGFALMATKIGSSTHKV